MESETAEEWDRDKQMNKVKLVGGAWGTSI